MASIGDRFSPREIAANAARLQQSIQACIKSGIRFLEDAEWLTHRETTGVALAMFAQEEFAKAFSQLDAPGQNVVYADVDGNIGYHTCLLYTSPSPRDGLLSRMPSSA